MATPHSLPISAHLLPLLGDPLPADYAADGVGEKLVKTGTYALVRHPGVLWLGALLFNLVIVSKSRSLLVAAPVWLFMAVLYAWVQDRFFFGRMFPGYAKYCEETLMLIPTKRSLIRCWRTMGNCEIAENGNDGREREFRREYRHEPSHTIQTLGGAGRARPF